MFFSFLVSNVVAPLPVGIEGVQWAKDVPKFACSIDGCDASYMAKYNLVWHLQTHHNVTMEPSKPGCPSTREQGPIV
jgi:hypothetical protein